MRTLFSSLFCCHVGVRRVMMMILIFWLIESQHVHDQEKEMILLMDDGYRINEKVGN